MIFDVLPPASRLAVTSYLVACLPTSFNAYPVSSSGSSIFSSAIPCATIEWIFLAFAISVVILAFFLIVANFGIAIAANMAMIAITMINSIRVNPFFLFLIFPPKQIYLY